ncbi:hypothetical protein F5X97DRAFT_308391 [Nemania serpens]|nr:hypothetical protein F5X97DRAFT_308391 [Nemania serpens]
MAFRVFEDAVNGTLFVFILVCTPIVILVTFLRFVATKKAQRKFGLEDYLALLALLFNLAFNALILWTVIEMNGKNALAAFSGLPPETVQQILRVGYAVNFFFPLNQTCAKLSLLALYYRIFNVRKAFRLWIYGVASAQIAWGTAILFTRIFACVPIRRFWDRRVPGTCVDAEQLLIAPEVLNSAIDFIMVGMAIWMVRQLQMPRSSQRKLVVLFALGGLTGIIGIIKIADSHSSVGKSGLDAIWDVVQMCTAIICCTTPIYRSLLSTFNVFMSGVSRSSLWRLGSSRKSGSGKDVTSSHFTQVDESSTHELHGQVYETGSYNHV